MTEKVITYVIMVACFFVISRGCYKLMVMGLDRLDGIEDRLMRIEKRQLLDIQSKMNSKNGDRTTFS